MDVSPEKTTNNIQWYDYYRILFFNDSLGWALIYFYYQNNIRRFIIF